MANPEHLAKLKEGVEVWDDWRKKNPDLQPDLRRAHLSQAQLQGVNLSTNLIKTWGTYCCTHPLRVKP